MAVYPSTRTSDKWRSWHFLGVQRHDIGKKSTLTKTQLRVENSDMMIKWNLSASGKSKPNVTCVQLKTLPAKPSSLSRKFSGGELLEHWNTTTTPETPGALPQESSRSGELSVSETSRFGELLCWKTSIPKNFYARELPCRSTSVHIQVKRFSEELTF